MKVFKNKLTGELHAAENKTRAWLYFYEKAKDGTTVPTIKDITENS
jgi:hypothetical protein